MPRTEIRIGFRDARRSGRAVDVVIAFLERDDYRRRTGYAKEYAWHLLKGIELTRSQRRRLQEVALRYLHRRMRREFWYMCRFIHRIADVSFRSQVAMLTQSKDALLRKRASLLQAYLVSPDAGEVSHKEFNSECFDSNLYARRQISLREACIRE